MAYINGKNVLFSANSVYESIAELGNAYITAELIKKTQLKPEFAESEEWLKTEGNADKTKLYVTPDNFIWAWMYTEKVIAGYNNLAEPLPNNKTDTSKWINNCRISSSGLDTTSGSATNKTVCNPIPIKTDDVIRVKGVSFVANVDRMMLTADPYTTGNQQYVSALPNSDVDYEPDGDVHVFKILNAGSTFTHIRFAFTTPTNPDDVIITVGDEIKDGEVVKEYAWTNTNHSFIPNDYDDEFVALNEAISEAKADIVNLENTSHKLQESIKTIDSSIKTIDSKIENIGETEIPSHWNENGYLDDKIAAVKALQDVGGKDCFSFVVMTDLHYPSNLGHKAPLLAKKIMDECDIRFALCLGDTQTRGCHASKDLLLDENILITEMFAPIQDRLLRVQGNHDGNYGTLNGSNYAYRITPQELHSHIYRKVGLVGDVHFDESGSGYWIDDTANKVRYILLNTHNTAYELNADGTQKYPNMHTFRFGQSQYDMVIEALKTVPTESWAVVMGGHVALGTNGGYSAWGDGTQSGADCYLMENLLTAYKNKENFTGSFAGTWGNDAVNVTCNFTSAKGQFVGFFGGHTHTDTVTVQGINRITTRCDAKEENTDALRAERIAGRTTEQSFDVFTVNKATRRIYATKIGAGSDRGGDDAPISY